MKQTIYLLALGCMLAIACNNNDKTSAGDATPTADSVVSGEVDSTFSGENMTTLAETAFGKYARSQLSHFDWTHFVMTTSWKEDSQRVRPFQGGPAFYEAYGRFIRYSPDSSYFLDMDSYNVDLKKDKTGHWTATTNGPDSEISLVDPKKKERRRLLFLGPGSSVQDGYWLNKDNVVLLGVLEAGTNVGKRVSLWKFNLPSRTFYLYELPDSTAAGHLKSYWKKERFRDVIMP